MLDLLSDFNRETNRDRRAVLTVTRDRKLSLFTI